MAKANRRQHGEGSLYQRKDGRWVTEIQVGYKPDGRPDRRYLYGATPDEALTARDEFRQDQEQGYTPTPGTAPRLGWWMWHWLDTICTANEHTKYKYRAPIKSIERHIGRVKLDEISEDPIESMYAALRTAGLSGKPLSETTVRLTHRILSTALKAAVARRATTKCRRNPCPNVTLRPAERPEILPPEADEAARILAEADRQSGGARWSVGLGMGTRQGEALGLLWPAVNVDDVNNASLRIDWELIRLPVAHGCADPHACGARLHRYPCPPDCPKAARKSGRRHTCITATDPKLCPPDCTDHARRCPDATGGLVLTRPKSPKSRRSVPIPRPLAERLRRHRAQQATDRLALGAAWKGWGHDPATCGKRRRPREIVCTGCRKPFEPDALVFTATDGRPRDPRQDWQEWTDLLDSLGIAHYRTHDMRHYTATLLLDLGVDARIVQEIVGHSSAAFTQSTYQHVGLTLQRDAMDKIGQQLWASQ